MAPRRILHAFCQCELERKACPMKDWYSRPVFFVKDAERSIAFYRDKLSCTLSWNYQEQGRAVVCQMSRSGFEVILAAQDETKAGHGRIFVSIDHEQEAALRQQIAANGLIASDDYWGMPVIVIEDPDGNQLLFSPPTRNAT
jgi:catechol 2,3-dioxygenase-like lactoylglutathione lyase family enzyme